MMDSRSVQIMILIILTCAFSLTTAELLRPPQPPQHNYAFKKFRPPPPEEPSFFQRVTSWIFPWGGVTSEEEFHAPASPKIDNNQVQSRPQQQYLPAPRLNPVQVRDTEPTTARTTQSPPVTKCSPCNKVPWIPMMPTYQLPMVNSGGQHQVYFKHHFGNENPYAQVPASTGYKYGPPSSTQAPYSPGYKYGPPSSTQPPLTTPIKIQDGLQGHQYYGVPPIKNVQFQGYQYTTPGYQYSTPGYQYTTPGYQYSTPGYQYNPPAPRTTTYKPNTNTIDTSVVTFTTGKPQNNRPSRFTAAGTITNPEYLPPPNVLPLENEGSSFVPIPIPNLSPSPIPPLFDAKNFLSNPYTSQKTGFIKIVPLEPVAQLSNNVNVQVRPEGNLPQFEAVRENPAVEVISSNLVAEFTIAQQELRHEVTTHRPIQHNNVRFNLDIGNNLDANTTLHSAIVVESLETVTDNIGAGSEHEYEHNINQALDSFSNKFEGSDIDPINAQESNNPFGPLQDNYDDFEVATTTDANYIVKFEPSIQTAADLAEKTTKKNKSEPFKKNRLTPLELLDSPIHHVVTGKPKVTTVTEPPPPFKPLEDFTKKLATLWTSPIPISTSTEPTVTPTYRPTVTTQLIRTTAPPMTSSVAPTSSTTLSFLSKVSSGIFAGITPPREPILQPKPSLATKKPKQIQIVIPYMTYHKPSPFKIQEEQELITYRPIRGHYVTHPTRTKETTTTEKIEIKTQTLIDENFNAHGYHNDQEYPDHAQESKIVESKVTIEPPRTTKYFTKILANNIRDLLKKEKTPKPTKPKIDLIKLQKNIDGWTEQSFKGKASTMSLLGHTKAIPRSFLSTTMRATTIMKLPTTTLSPRTTFDPDLMEETKRQYDNILYKKDDADLLYVKRHDRFLDRDNELVLINNNLTYNSIHDGVHVFAPKTTLTPKELWKRLHLTVSPLTNERIYVVTPQPAQETEAHVSTFRPRFAIRPTIAAMKQPRKLKTEADDWKSDRMGIAHVENVDGHSKIVRIITPTQTGVTSPIEVTTVKPKS